MCIRGRSEDDGSAKTGRAYEIKADAPMVEPFKNIARRLHVGEAGPGRAPVGWDGIPAGPPPAPRPPDSRFLLTTSPAAHAFYGELGGRRTLKKTKNRQISE